MALVEGGTEVVMSSIMINDNVIDLLAKPGAKAGDPIVLDSSPQTSTSDSSITGSPLRPTPSHPWSRPFSWRTLTARSWSRSLATCRWGSPRSLRQ